MTTREIAQQLVRRSCPWCGPNTPLVVVPWDTKSEVMVVKCYGCGATGPHGLSTSEAWLLWSRDRTNEPLT